MDDLPELPFEKILGYLSLEDRLKLRAVSRSCHIKIDHHRVKSLCYSERPSGFIWGKSRWVSGACAQNFISSTRFESFFNAFGRSVLSNLKHLRLCDLSLDLENKTAFSRILKSFGQLEELDIIRAQFDWDRILKLNLPMLTSIQLEGLCGMKKLTLDTPRLQIVKLQDRLLTLDIVHGESVERLIIWDITKMTQKRLKNLKYLHAGNLQRWDSTFLFSLEQLKEIHLNSYWNVSKLFNQKQRYRRADLKIFYFGLHLNGPDDPAIHFLNGFNEEAFRRLANNSSRLADVIPFCDTLYYEHIECVALESAINILNRFVDLNKIIVDNPVQDIQRFLDLLKNLDNILDLQFSCEQPQELFDRLPEHSAVQRLMIDCGVLDFQFLFRLKHLVYLEVRCHFYAKLIRKAFKELPFLSWFKFKYLNKVITIEIDHPKQFRVLDYFSVTTVSNINAVIQLITEKTGQKKRKTGELLE